MKIRTVSVSDMTKEERFEEGTVSISDMTEERFEEDMCLCD